MRNASLVGSNEPTPVHSVGSSCPPIDVIAIQLTFKILKKKERKKTDRPSSLSTLSAYSKWSLPNSSDPSSRRSLDAVNPLRAFVSLPPVTFGPRRLGAFLGLT
ncbi:hypothetical protein EJ110_NYTH54956 [Nymphaea thermarum]|nr:hypothetical protein EJ110_NYTH54956 [Nymphaea thermarum]